ncbi:diaminobutyrate acetyltransferase [Mesobacterium pallidum]|uniref:diaminobutyrate acetyltransferase n=1 Tax=Mesobacterium pallidum TaxID=2872037 RepID=UPI001EE2D64C|nr:diaminobutyrate acetyltransferase [Mesobacterium pallidum]
MTDVTLRKPTKEDGAAVYELVKSCKPLDENSMYCNLIQCDHFADRCILAEVDGEIVGWISGYILPDADDTFFVWQVAVGAKARGLGLGTRMLGALLDRDGHEHVNHLQTTITADNDASWALFRKFARSRGAEVTSERHFAKEDHFNGEHDCEHMVTLSFPAQLRAVA